MKVAILPTGRMEWKALPSALNRLFPEHEFYAVPEQHLFDSKGPFDGVTSSRLTLGPTPQNAITLIEKAAQEALGDRTRPAADLVVIVDDLELANLDQPGTVMEVMKHAATHHLGCDRVSRVATIHDRTTTALANKVSFHLAVPMIESWLFGDPEALATAGVPRHPGPLLVGPHLEDFYTGDPGYLAAGENDCPQWNARGKKRKERPKWLGQDRARHPKGYLQWLCRDGQAASCTGYEEMHGGAAGLGALRWEALLAQPGLSYLAAMLEDLTFKLGGKTLSGLIPATQMGDTAQRAVTSLQRRPAHNVLRNL